MPQIGATIVRFFLFNGGECEATQNFSCLYLITYHNFEKCELAQKIGNQDRTEPVS